MFDTAEDSEFKKQYYSLLEKQFGSELDKIKKSKETSGTSLAYLEEMLKQGGNIFDREDREALMEAAASQ